MSNLPHMIFRPIHKAATELAAELDYQALTLPVLIDRWFPKVG